MSISSYAELKTAVENWLDRTDLTSRVPEFIALGEARIARRLRVRGITSRDTSTTTVAGTAYYNLPSGFLEARSIRWGSNPTYTLSYRTPQQISIEYPDSVSSISKAFTIIGSQIQLAPIPNAGKTLEIVYYQKLDALSDSNPTNWLTTNAPDLLLYGALIEAEVYLVNDPRVGIWKSAFDEAMTEWNVQEEQGRYSGSHLEMRTATGNP